MGDEAQRDRVIQAGLVMSHDPLARGMHLLGEAERLRASDVLGATAKAYEALHAFESVPTRRGMGFARLLLGELSLFTTDLAEARDHLVAARDFFAGIPLPLWEARARRVLGDVFTRIDDLEAARAEFEAALAIVRSSRDARAIAEVTHRLGSLERRCGRPRTAMRHYRAALEAYADLSDPEGTAGVLLSVGNTLTTVGADEAASGFYEDSRALFSEAGDRLGQANAERFLAASTRRRGRTALALQWYRRALTGYTEIGDILGESYTRQALGEMATEAGDLESARRELARSIELLATVCDPVGLVSSVTTLAEGYLAEGDQVGALEALSWGVAEARQASRWSGSATARNAGGTLITQLELRALTLTLELGHRVEAEANGNDVARRILGYLPILLDGPPSPEPEVETLRQRVHDLAATLGPRADPPPASG